MKNEDMTFGADGGEITIPDVMKITNQKFSYDYYCAMAAAQLYSLVDMAQYPNADDICRKIVNRTKIFGDLVKSNFPDAFE